MPTVAGKAIVPFEGDFSLLEQGAASTVAKLGPTFGGFGKLAAAAVAGIGIAAIATTASAVKMAGDFQAVTTTIVTGAGESAANLDLIRQGLLSLAGQVGTTPVQLAQGLYQIESAGYHGAQALDILKISAEGAKVGMADQAVVADAVTTALNAYHLGASNAAQVTNTLIATVALGKTHMQDLAGSMGAILPVASALGIPFDQISAAMATMTVQGTAADRASQSLRFMLASLAGPTAAAAKEFSALGIGEAQIPGITASTTQELQSLGLHTSEVAATLNSPGGLPAALKMITDAIGKQFPAGSAAYNAALRAAVGGTRGFTAALELTGQNMAVFQTDITTIDGKVQAAGNSVAGWAMVQGDFNTKMDQAHGAIDAFMISVGTQFLPILGNAVTFLTSQGLPALQQFAGWVHDHIIPALQQFGGFVSGTVIPDLQQFVGWVINNVVPSVDRFALAIAGLVSWFVDHLLPPLLSLIHIVGPALSGIFSFLSHNVWLVEAALGAMVLRLVAIKGLEVATWVMGMANAFLAFAGEQGVGKAVLALGGVGSNMGLSGALAKFRGEAQLTASAALPELEGGLTSASGGFAGMAGAINPVTLGILAVGAAITALVIAQPWQSLHDRFLNDLQTPGTTAYSQLHSDNLNAITDLENYANAQGWTDIAATAAKTYQEVLNAHVSMIQQMIAGSSEYQVFELSQIGTLSATQQQALRDYSMAYTLATGQQRDQAAQLASEFTADQIKEQQAAGLVPPAIAAIALQLQGIPGLLALQQKNWDTWSVVAGLDVQAVQSAISNASAMLNGFNLIVQNSQQLLQTWGSYLNSPAIQQGLSQFKQQVANLPPPPSGTAPGTLPALPPNWKSLLPPPSSPPPPPSSGPPFPGYGLGGLAQFAPTGGLAMLHGIEYVVPQEKASPELQALMAAAINGTQVAVRAFQPVRMPALSSPTGTGPSVSVGAMAPAPVTIHPGDINIEVHGFTSEDLLPQIIPAIDRRVREGHRQLVEAARRRG